MKTAAMALRSVPRAALSLPPAWRRRAIAVLLALAVLAGGYWLWFRDSSFARVKDVYVTGLDGPQTRAIRAALETAALSQTTLDVNEADLQDAVSTYPVVRSVSAQGDFPHKLRIDVALNLPVAVIQSPNGRKPVAADGLLLPDVPIGGGLPTIRTQSSLPSDRVTGGRAAQLLRVVALAPEALRSRVQSVSILGDKGIVVALTRGPELRFGDSSRLPAKWIAAARVLAAVPARGATYVDLRLPERPAAGGLPTTGVIPLAPAGEAAAQGTPTTTAEPTTAASPQSAATPAQSAAVTGQSTAQHPQPQVQTSPQPSTTP